MTAPLLAEILVLVVAEDHDEIGLERVDRLARLAEPVDEALAVFGGRGDRVGHSLRICAGQVLGSFKASGLGRWRARGS